MATATVNPATSPRRLTPRGGRVATPPYRSYEDGDFIVYEDVPVWCEHFSKQAEQHFGPAELARVVERCNGRIDDTDDYSPIVIRHTKGDDGSGSDDPPVVGLAGPFKLGQIGKLNPKAAILARMRFFKSEADRVKRYPRVSVEYWFSKKDPTNGYFDPISILGADTPELDLGLRYGKHGDDEVCSRFSKNITFDDLARADYAATSSPGGSNTFVPGMGGSGSMSAGQKRRDADQDDDNADDSDDNADGSAQYERESCASDLNGAKLSAASIAQIVEAIRPVVREIIVQELPAPQSPEQFSAEANAPKSGDVPVTGAGAESTTTDSAPAGADLDGDGDTDIAIGEEQPSGMEGGRDAAAGSKGKPQTSSKGKPPMFVDLKDKKDDKARSSAQAAGNDDTAVARYQKQVDDLTKERDELRAKYEKASRESTDKTVELDEIKSRVSAIEADGRRNARYAKLRDLYAEGYVFELDDELKEFADASDEEFARHESRIRAHYQRVPIGRAIPLAPATHIGPNGKEVSPEDRERFAKEAAGNVAKARAEGKSASYGDELKAVYAREKKEMPV